MRNPSENSQVVGARRSLNGRIHHKSTTNLGPAIERRFAREIKPGGNPEWARAVEKTRALFFLPVHRRGDARPRDNLGPPADLLFTTDRSMKLFALLLCFLADGIIAGADVLAKRWSAGAPAWTFWFAWALYAGVSGLWFVLLKAVGDLGRSSVVWASTGVIAGLVIGALMGERPSAVNWAGVGLAALGVAMTSWR